MPRPFPAATVRDLIGIARLLYRTWSQHGIANDAQLLELVVVGKDLQESLRMAKSAHNPKQMREAWERAELATRRLGYLIDVFTGVKSLIVSAFSFVDQTATPREREPRAQRAVLDAARAELRNAAPRLAKAALQYARREEAPESEELERLVQPMLEHAINQAAKSRFRADS